MGSDPGGAARPSLYVHVPFCVSRCAYCDFHRSAPVDPAGVARWLEAVERHLAALAEDGGFGTVYVGGGTPSALDHGDMRRLLDAVAAAGRGVPPAEWTVEANPEDLDGSLLDLLAEAGVDRLSVGVQSFEDGARQAAGRRGSAASVLRRLESSAARWTGRLSLDLMYGLPGQTAGGLESDIRTAATLGAGHLSLYELTLEEGTPFHEAVAGGRLVLPDEDARADQYDAALGALADAGYRRYEVSNWAKAGQECLHNLNYWRLGDWRAAGPSGVANALVPGGYRRVANPSDDARYAADPVGGAETTLVAGRDAMFETLMMGLRVAEGLDTADFTRRFGSSPSAVFGDVPARSGGRVLDMGGRWLPTEAGMDTLNGILVGCLEERR